MKLNELLFLMTLFSLLISLFVDKQMAILYRYISIVSFIVFLMMILLGIDVESYQME